jgi:hypothetical protein
MELHHPADILSLIKLFMDSPIIPKIRAGGKLVGAGGNSPADAAGIAEFIKLGANFITISALGLLRLGAEDFRQRVQAAL